MAMPDKYDKCRNRGNLSLKILFQCAFLCCLEEKIKLVAETYENRRLLLYSCIHKDSGALVRGDRFKVIESTLWCIVLPCQLKSTLYMCYPGFVVAGAIQILQRCNLPRPDVEKRSSSCILHTDNLFLQIVMKQVRC